MRRGMAQVSHLCPECGHKRGRLRHQNEAHCERIERSESSATIPKRRNLSVSKSMEGDRFTPSAYAAASPDRDRNDEEK